MNRKGAPVYLLFVGLFVLVLAAFWFAGRSEQSKSPVAMATSAPDPTEVAFAALTFDFTPSVLTPDDVADLFSATTYSIQQQLKGPGMQGVTVTYPTRVIEHTSGFAEGFATQIKVFADEGRAARTFDATVAQQALEKQLDLGTYGDASLAFEGTAASPEGYDLGSTEYVMMIRRRNVLATVTIRRNESVPAARLSEIAKLVLGRLDASARGR